MVFKFFFFIFFTFLNWEKTDMVLQKRGLFSIGNGAKFWPLVEKGRKCPGSYVGVLVLVNVKLILIFL